jgi:hypothetical protein
MRYTVFRIRKFLGLPDSDPELFVRSRNIPDRDPAPDSGTFHQQAKNYLLSSTTDEKTTYFLLKS